jgi:ABC-type transport system substrate-binding protein
VQPGAATEWSVDESGLVWTFKLDPNLMWSDGTPVTADDYVATFRYGADPSMPGTSPGTTRVIKNWTQAVNGEVASKRSAWWPWTPTRCEFTTETPAPFLPAMLVYSNTDAEEGAGEHGGFYNSDPTLRSRPGPYKLVEWTKDQRLVYEINPDYKGTNIPYIES